MSCSKITSGPLPSFPEELNVSRGFLGAEMVLEKQRGEKAPGGDPGRDLGFCSPCLLSQELLLPQTWPGKPLPPLSRSHPREMLRPAVAPGGHQPSWDGEVISGLFHPETFLSPVVHRTGASTRVEQEQEHLSHN